MKGKVTLTITVIGVLYGRVMRGNNASVRVLEKMVISMLKKNLGQKMILMEMEC